MKTVPITVWIVPIILLAIAIFAGGNDMHGAAPLPYGYFIFLRIVACLAAGCIAAVGFGDGKQWWPTAFVLIAVLFNPFIPIEMKKGDWIIFDVITAAVYIAHLTVVRLREKVWEAVAFGRLMAVKCKRWLIKRKWWLMGGMAIGGLLLFITMNPSVKPEPSSARSICRDNLVHAVKGQLVLLPSQPNLEYLFSGHHGYVFPRQDSVVMGGSEEMDAVDDKPDMRICQTIPHDGARLAHVAPDATITTGYSENPARAAIFRERLWQLPLDSRNRGFAASRQVARERDDAAATLPPQGSDGTWTDDHSNGGSADALARRAMGRSCFLRPANRAGRKAGLSLASLGSPASQ